MRINYPKRGEVNISTGGYPREVLYDSPEKIIGRAETPAATHLIEVRSGDGQVLPDETHDCAFHHYVAQLLFASTIRMKDI